MRKINLGFVQGRLTSPPSRKILQYFPQKNWRKEFVLAGKLNFDYIEYFGERKFNKLNPIWRRKSLILISKLVKENNLINYSFCDDFFINNNFETYKNIKDYYNKLTYNLSKIKIKVYVLALFEKSCLTKISNRKDVGF